MSAVMAFLSRHPALMQYLMERPKLIQGLMTAFKHKKKIGAGLLGGFIGLVYAYRQRAKRLAEAEKQMLARPQSFVSLVKEEEKTNRKKRVAVNKEFLRRLRRLLRIVIPGVRSKEFLLVVLHTGFLVARTFMSIYVAQLDGTIVKAIVDRNVWAFGWRMVRWLAIAIPATYINSMIRYLESKLSIAFRTRLVDHVYSLYMENETYYRVDNVDSRLQNADQCLTEDVARFCQDLAHIYSQISKPILDIILMSAQLYMLGRERSGDGRQLHYPWMIAASVLSLTGVALRVATPPFGKLVAEEARRYGHLRAVHARLITHAEEIAFYGGHQVEEVSLRTAYGSLVTHMNYIYKKRIFYTMLEQFLMKYMWGAAGMVMIAIPTLLRNPEHVAARQREAEAVQALQKASGGDALVEDVDSVSTRTQDFITARGLLVSAADAMERLMSSWKEVTELAGRTARVSEMMDVFNDVGRGVYVKNVGGAASSLLQQTGKVVESEDTIKLEDVPIVTPNGDVLVQSLNVTIKRGMHLLITGPNGCGKSSLFRMLGGLWAVHGGTLTKPTKGDMFYIPQRPYLSQGSLREQFIYPHTKADMKVAGVTDDDLLAILEVVDLAHVVHREGGWDAINDWRDVLSGGEKQRVGMARVFYHKPKYAILDECTSAVSIDVEGRMYMYAKELGITLLTVTHRPSLWKYHSHLLQFDGQGGVSFRPLNDGVRISLKDEKSKIESALAGVAKQQERLQELCTLLGEDSAFFKRDRTSPDVE